MNDTRAPLERSVGLASTAAGLVMLAGAWSLALRGRGLSWSLETVVEVHRQEPLLFLALFPPVLAVVMSVAYVRADQQARLASMAVPVGRELLPPVPDGLVSVDEHGRIVEINRSAERMFGRASVEVRGTQLDALLEERRDAQVSKRLSGRGEPLGIAWTATARHRDGTAFAVEIAATERTAGRPCCLLVRAVPDTDAAGSGEQVHLLGEVGRELRHPADVAVASAERALHRATQLDRDGLVAELRHVLHGCRSVRRVAEDLADLRREGEEFDGVTRSVTERVDVLALCDAVLDELEALSVVRVELEPRGAIQHVRADPQKLTRMLHLLLRGAGGRLRLRVWCTEHAAHLAAHRTQAAELHHDGAHPPDGPHPDPGDGRPAGEPGSQRPLDLPWLSALVLERLANDLGVEVGSADGALWHLSLPVHSRKSTPTLGDELTVPLDRAHPSSTTTGALPKLAYSPVQPANASRRDGVSLRPTRLGPSSSKNRESTLSRGRVRIAVLGVDANTRWALKHALAARGIQATALEPNVALPHVLRLTRYRALVVQVGATVQPFAALRNANLEGVRLELVALAHAGREGCRLRCDSLHLHADGAQVGGALARILRRGGSAVIFHPEKEAREQVVAELRRAGWACLVAGDVGEARRLLDVTKREFLVVDLTAPGAVPLLAELDGEEARVRHVAVWPRSGIAPEVSQEWLASSQRLRSLSDLVHELAGALPKVGEAAGVGA